MATLAQSEGRFDIGRVIQRTFAVIGRNAALFFGSALLIVGVPNILLGLVAPSMVTANGQLNPTLFEPTTLSLVVVGGLIVMLVSLMLQVVLIRATIFDLAGERADLGTSLRVAAGLVLPLLGLSIVSSFGVGLATLLLIVPGIMLYCAWCVAAPALVEERGGVFASLGRSRALTKGSRWKIFALLLIFVLALLLFQGAVGLLGFVAGPGGTVTTAATVLNAVVSSVTTMVGAAGIASMYVELRSQKEGASFANLQEIFG